MAPDEIVPKYEELLHGTIPAGGVAFVQSSVESIDLQQKQVRLSNGTVYEYGNLVLALGSVTAFFAEGAKENTLRFQSQVDVDAIKKHLKAVMQQAVQTDNPEVRRHLLTTTVIGGEPTGVELSLTLGDLLPQWYETLGGKPDELRIVLLNRGDILKGDINSHLADTAKRQCGSERFRSSC